MEIVLLDIPKSIPDFIWDLIWAIVTALLTTGLISYLDRKRLQPVRELFINSIISKIDDERLLLDTGFIKVLIEQQILSFKIMNQNPSLVQQAANGLQRSVAIPLTSQAKESALQINSLLSSVEKKLQRIVAQIESSQMIFTIEINAKLSEIRQQIEDDLDTIESVKAFLTFPTPESFISRRMACFFSKDFYNNKVKELSITAYTVKWLDSYKNFNDNEQTLLVTELYESYPFKF